MDKNTYIIRPLISEKSLKEAADSRYTFVVRRNASKDNIKKEVEKLFNVKVKSVYTSFIKGTKTKNTKLGRKVSDITYKKARVLLPKDQKIELFDVKKSWSKDNF